MGETGTEGKRRKGTGRERVNEEEREEEERGRGAEWEKATEGEMNRWRKGGREERG